MAVARCPRKMIFRKPDTRVPEPFEDIQANFCKNIKCSNYGVLPDPEHKKPGWASHGHPDRYILADVSPTVHKMKCLVCKQKFGLRSNQAVHEEFARLSDHIRKPGASCPNITCKNHLVPVSEGPEYYYVNGKTKAGSPRYVCQACKKSFTVPQSPLLHQGKTYKNKAAFEQFLAGATIWMICRRISKITPTMFYTKLSYFYRQCRAFAGSRESRFLDDRPILVDDPDNPGKKIDVLRRVYVSMDQQVFFVNWQSKKDKRATMMRALGSCDQERKYVFGFSINYDPEIDLDDVLEYNDTNKEDELPIAFRRYARFVTPKLHQILAARNEIRKKIYERQRKRLLGRKRQELTLAEESNLKYANTLRRGDIEFPDEEIEKDTRIPLVGAQVYSGYMIYGHFHLLRKMLHKAGKVRFFFEQESGLAGGCLTAFADRIKEKRCDAFYVWFEKNLRSITAEQEERDGKALIRSTGIKHGIDGPAAALMLLKDRIRHPASIRGQWGDKFMVHPFPSIGEPRKEVCYITDRGSPAANGLANEDHLARLYDKASLHSLDTFFMQARAAIGPLQYSKKSRRRVPKGGKWEPHHAYRPDVVVKYIEMFRVFHNFVLVGEDGKTPAMRMGLAKTPIPIEKILYFKPT